MKTALVSIALVLGLSGCSTYLREQSNLPVTRPDLPEQCVELYYHTTGDDSTSDKFAGIYCKVDEPEVEAP